MSYSESRAERLTQFIRPLVRTCQIDDLSVLLSDLKFNNNNVSAAMSLRKNGYL